MATIFDGVRSAKPQRSTFDLSHDRKFTMEGGKLTPVFCKEVVPGDKFSISVQSLIRLIPMVGPTMHKLDMDIHFFYIPNRLLWKNWEKFITGSRLAGADSGQVPVHPYISYKRYLNYLPSKVGDMDRFIPCTIWDYLGYPVANSKNGFDSLKSIAEDIKVNSLPLRAYYLIWREYYRDQNLHDSEWLDELFENDGDDLDFWSQYCEDYNAPALFNRCWEKDYFTSALPFVQKGSPLSIPLTGILPVTSDPEHIKLKPANSAYSFQGMTDHELRSTSPSQISPDGAIKANVSDGFNTSYQEVVFKEGQFTANLSGADVVTINELRAAFQAQLWLERNARAGTRYIESLEAHFGVRPADYRLQRPELFGAFRVPIQMSEVLQTSETATSPQGNMAGHGIGYDRSSFNVFCPEHGWIIGIASIKPRTSYIAAVDKSIFRLDYLDYYWPEFARLGEQEIKRKELGVVDTLSSVNAYRLDETFGYQSRYAEYRSALSTVHGGMRNDPVLKSWHMARRNVGIDKSYGSMLCTEFVEADPTKDIFADTQAKYQYVVHMNFKVFAKRPMPFFADPGLIDHS